MEEEIFVTENSDNYFEIIPIDSILQKKEIIEKFSQEIPKQLNIVVLVCLTKSSLST
jgi:hypothetical protein